MYIQTRRGSSGGFKILMFLVAAGVIGVMFFTSWFERNSPVVNAPTNIVWNFTAPLSVPMSDDVGIVSYEATFQDETHTIPLASSSLDKQLKSTVLSLKFPLDQRLNMKQGKITIKVKDGSLWGFFQGNETKVVIDVTPDLISPLIAVMGSSPTITKGGSALVVFNATDANLKDVYVKTADGHKFKATPFVKNGYYATLFAWDAKMAVFQASIEAVDKGGNRSITPLNIASKNISYKDSNIKIDDKFLTGKITTLANGEPAMNGQTPLNRFVYINRDLRNKNQDLIKKLTTVNPKPVNDFTIAPFLPLKNGKVVATYGDHRHFFYNEQNVSESHHMGIDLASVKAAPIVASNSGKVIFAGDNGIFGNMPLIDHGLGLYTLYGHCTTLNVKKGDMVAIGQPIATTGVSGLALGDHLHFGVVVQGVDVRPIEWIDAKWVKSHITDVIQSTKALLVAAPK